MYFLVYLLTSQNRADIRYNQQFHPSLCIDIPGNCKADAKYVS